jgi:hypothetical protein
MVLELARGRSQYYSWFSVRRGCGCGTWLAWGGGEGRDTLLSPEASAVRQVSLSLQDRLIVGWVAWVGVFLVNWIVDASIFATTCRHPGVLCCHLRVVGWGVGVVVVAMF